MKEKIAVLGQSSEFKNELQSFLSSHYELVEFKDCKDLIEGSYLLAIVDKAALERLESQNLVVKKSTLIALNSTNRELKLRYLKRGILATLSYPFDADELIASITNLENLCQSNVDDKIVYGPLVLIPFKQELTVNERPVSLTPTEYKILSLLVKNKGKVIERERIFQHINRDDIKYNDRIIDVHISSLRKKLQKYPVKIKSIYGEGYKIAQI